MRNTYFFGLAALLGLWILLHGAAVRADEARLAIGGYDPVAYFTDGKPVPGASDIEYSWHDMRWRFATAAHRDLFVKDPEHYAPQYEGYCAMGVSLDKGAAHKDTVDPNAWAVVDGKLYLTYSNRALERWRQKHL
jgi:YHS domain